MHTHSSRWLRRLPASALLLAMAGCSPDRLTNPNSPTPDAVASNPLQALQYEATGVLAGERNAIAAFITGTGQFGREVFSISPTESRSVTGFYRNFDDPAGQATGGWSDRYAIIRNITTFYTAIGAATTLTPVQQSAARGFGETLEALDLSYVLATRNRLGLVVQTLDDPRGLAPFVSRDSAYRYVIAKLDQGYADLQGGGAAFPFTLPSVAGAGFTAFGTPTTFAQFNRALRARVGAWYASVSGNSTAQYQLVLTALTQSFVAPLTVANLKTGPAYLFANQTTDIANALFAASATLYAHPSIRDDGTVSLTDLRYVNKVLTGKAQQTPTDASTPTNLGFKVYATQTSPVPIIDNEELVLLRAEARWFTGDPGGALDDINAVRTVSGGLAARGAFADEADFITELLAQRRLSLLLQGHRWVDVRRFGRLGTLPLSGTTFLLTANQVIPEAECLARRRNGDPALACPVFTAVQ